MESVEAVKNRDLRIRTELSGAELVICFLQETNISIPRFVAPVKRFQ